MSMRIKVAVFFCYIVSASAGLANDWSKDELRTLQSLWLGSLPPLTRDASNKFSDNPMAVDFGHRLFFDVRLSENGKVACATCHIPALYFTDGLKVSEGIGKTQRNAPTIVGTAYSPWFFWDGRKDSQWSQALGPIENPLEHGFSRAQTVSLIQNVPDYRKRYEKLFGPLPSLTDKSGVSAAFANLGKAIASYERQIMPGPGKFDKYVAALLKGAKHNQDDELTKDEKAGLRLFIGEANCLRCHNGPLFSNFDFHNTGVPSKAYGRSEGVQHVLKDGFNCKSKYSDSAEQDCAELNFVKSKGRELRGAFKTPILRNLSKTAPYMHGGQFATLEDVLIHYNKAPVATIGTSELEKINLKIYQLEQIKSFLITLDGPVEAKNGLGLEPK